MRILTTLGVVVVLVAGAEHEMSAQLIDAPPGSIGGVFGGRRGVDPNRVSQSVDMTVDASSGYEDNPTIFGLDPGSRLGGQWFASTASSTGRYRVGNARRSFEARGRGIFDYRSDAEDWLTGGDLGAISELQLGRQMHRLNGAANVSYEPGWLFGSFGSISAPDATDAGLGVAPQNGILEQRWLVLSGAAAYEHHWSRRHVLSTQYMTQRLRPQEGVGSDSDTQAVQVEHRWSSTPNLTLLGAYRFDDNVQTQELQDPAAIRYHTFEGGLTFERRLSPSRRYVVTVRGGATRLVENAFTRGLQRTQPTLTGNVELAVSRTWTVNAEVSRRTVTLLGGVSALPVANDNVELDVTAAPSRRLRFALSGTYGRSKALGADIGRSEVTEGGGLSAEARYAVAPWAALFGSYGFYQHRIDDPSLALSGFPTRYDRHSVRVGMTLWVPLYGSF